jgi:hypothetical protein
MLSIRLTVALVCTIILTLVLIVRAFTALSEAMDSDEFTHGLGLTLLSLILAASALVAVGQALYFDGAFPASGPATSGVIRVEKDTSQ